MKARVFSDIHLEHFDRPDQLSAIAPIWEGNDAEVCILAGDITKAEIFKRGEKSVSRAITTEFFEKVSSSYSKVFYVPGNHEHYDGDFKTTTKLLKQSLRCFDNISVLETSSEYYGGWHFVGATLWTSFLDSPVERFKMGDIMSDFKGSIRVGPSYSRLTTDMVYRAHSESLYWMERAIPTLRGPVFIITHHAPTLRSSVDPEYAQYVPAYCNRLEEFILSHPSIKFWAHGHIHDRVEYEVGECRVVNNCLGYPNFASKSWSYDPSIFSLSLDLTSP